MDGQRREPHARQERLIGFGAPVASAEGHPLRIRDIGPNDAGEVLTLQRAAFVQEAILYDSLASPTLAQSLEQLQAELRENLGLVALMGERIVGAVRAERSGALLLIGRLAAAPDLQGAGIGSALLRAVEARGVELGCDEAELFTGSLSTANLRLYERHGYRETTRVDDGDGIQQVFLRKRLARTIRAEPPVKGQRSRSDTRDVSR